MNRKSFSSITGFVVATLVLLLAAPPLQAAGSARSNITISVFKVEGMTCGGCETGVKIAVKKLDGISKVKASFKESRAEVSYDATKVTPKQIVAAIEKLGYKAELKDEPENKD